ncbi:MAG: hypothetical protein AAF645_01055 [Myxococcota bacterium]
MMRALGLAAALLIACGSDPMEPVDPAPVALFEDGGGFFDTPWPSDLRRTENGLDMSGFPDEDSRIVAPYIAALQRLQGFGLASPVYFRFDAALDETTLRTEGDDPTALLIALDGSGDVHPAVAGFVAESTLYWPGNCVYLRPAFGAPLREQTRYAAVLLRGIAGPEGTPAERSPTIDAVLTGEAGVETLAAFYDEPLAQLSAAGIERDSILSLSVFTTQDASSELFAVRDHLDAQPSPTPVARSARMIDVTETYTRIDGLYNAPLYLDGEPPYENAGGALRFDESGAPVQQGSFEARYVMTIPRTEMPADGWPVILYAHGTGGDATSFLGATAERAAQLGYAMVGFDQIHNGPRAGGGSPEVLVFNFFNADAFRYNQLQGAVDLMGLARFVRDNPVAPMVLGEGTFFNGDELHFFGHSQGGLNGPLYLAADDTARGGILSAAGGTIAISLVEKTEPVNIPNVVGLALGVASDSERLIYEHPAFAMLSTVTDVTDITTFSPYLALRPRPGFAPKHVLFTQGTDDDFTPPLATDAAAVASGAPLFGPELRTVVGAAETGLAPAATPLSANVNGATVGLRQFAGGHGVAFSAEGRDLVDAFFSSALAGTPSLQ